MGYAIITRYHGPTNYRGSRVIGTGPALTTDDAAASRYVRATVGWDYGAGNGARAGEPVAYGGAYDGWGDSDANHRRAADAVVVKLRAAGWDVTLAPDDRGASLPDETGRVYVLRYGAEPLQEWTIGTTDDRCGTCGGPLETHTTAPDTLYCPVKS